MFYFFTTLIGIGFVGVTIILGIFCKKRFLKYIPSILTAVAALAFFIKAAFFATGWEDLAYAIFAMLSALYFVASIITAVIIEFVKKRS